ncbi:MAG TPA: FAD:protein FMN transferase [Chryseolinea sp.]|nr:FAD:protein FMN transferase [Chryseolinea sp.]
MDNRKKNIIYSAVLLVSILIVWLYRKNDVSEPIKVEGKTMGTTYHVTYFDSKNRDFKSSIDSLLVVVNKSINNYDSTSEVSRFNRSKAGIAINLPYFFPPVEKAKEIFQASDGAFDPTVMPLVNAWGFGAGKQINPDSAQIDSIKTFVGFEKVQFTKDSIWKSEPRVQLDFGGIGQGYGADVITDFLRAKGVSNMLVELGGEGMAVGKNIKTGKSWEIGILDPNSTYENQFFKAYISLRDKSFTTSGNYFNYREIDGKKYSHTIDPDTGFPAQHAILSASIFATDCTTADAWGTAMMVMGHEKAIELVKKHPELDVLLMYSNAEGKVETFMTPGIQSFVKLEP